MNIKIKLGIAGIIIGFILAFILYIFNIGDFMMLFFPALILAGLISYVEPTATTSFQKMLIFSFAIIITIVTYFMIGFIIGFINEKIHNRVLKIINVIAIILLILGISSIIFSTRFL